jgi:hypothetical protein
LFHANDNIIARAWRVKEGILYIYGRLSPTISGVGCEDGGAKCFGSHGNIPLATLMGSSFPSTPFDF